VVVGERDRLRRALFVGRFVGPPGPDFAVVGCLGLVGGWLVWLKTRRRKRVAVVSAATELGLGLLAAARLSGLDAQTACALRLLEDRGYSNVHQTEVSGMGHQNRPGLVLETFRPYWEGRKSRSDPLAPL
jgi:hypothetical protein